MRYLTTIHVAVLCGAVFLVGCSEETPPTEEPQSSQNQESSENRPPSPSPPAEVVALNEATFDAQLEQGVALVDFWAAWCGPCKIQGPIVEQVAEQIGAAAKVAKLDVDAFPQIARRYNISSIPTLIVFKDGKVVQQFVGVTQAETLVSAIQAALKAQG
ncbi:MAG: thioredoxin [Phycisphaerales bacterium]|nr:MAG: thioredoxin [Phycisphaerales bacterium]